MLPVLHIGPLAIQAPLLFVFLGFWVAIQLAEREAGRLKLDRSHVAGVLSTALLGGIVSGRLTYVGRFFEAFRQDWWGVISLNPSTIDPAGGILGGLLISAAYLIYRQLPFRLTLDAITPSLAILTIAQAGSFLASGAYYGSKADLPWAIFLWGAPRHPTQIYLLIGGLLVWVLIWVLRQRSPFHGFIVSMWLFAMTLVLLFIEGFRGSSLLFYGGIRLWQVVYLIIGLTTLAYIHFNLRLSR